MKKLVLCLAVAASAGFAQYKTEPAGAAPVFASLMQPGVKLLDGAGKEWCEVWFVSKAPSGPTAAEEAVAFPAIPHGALIGVVKFPGNGADRRGQTIKPGVYTLRYSHYPVDGNHQGVAPQRDFLVMAPAEADKDPKAQPKYEELMELSRKASGTPHPAVLEIGAPAGDATFPSLSKGPEEDWIYNVKVGDLPMAVIVVGKTAAG